MRIITVTHVNTQPGKYHITYKNINDRDKQKASIVYCGDAGDAAAKAMELAISYNGQYLILGSNKVIELIPFELRSN